MTIPRKLTEDETTILQRWCCDDGLNRLFYEAHQRLPFLESMLSEVEERITRQFAFSGDGGIVVPHKRYCQWCYSSWECRSGLIETDAKLHKPDCLYVLLREAVRP